MRVALIRIRRIMGIESLDIEPGSITVIEATNGAGKSSIVAALEALRNGGHDATLLRDGAESGSVEWVLDDETEITKTITPTKSTLSVKHPTMGKIGAGQTYIEKLSDALSFNPATFLTCDGAQRIKYLLESSKVELAPADLRAAIGDLMEVPDVITGHPLNVITRVHKAIYDKRTEHNTTVKTSTTFAEQLLAGISETDNAASIDASIASLEQDEKQIVERFVAARDAADEALNDVSHSFARQIQELERKLADLKNDRDLQVRLATSRRNTAHSELNMQESEVLRPITDELAALRERKRTIQTVENNRTIAAQHQQNATQAQATADAHTAALKNLDALKEKLLAQSPVKGLAVGDGDLVFRDRPWKRVNTAERVKIVLKLAAHRAGDLPLVCVDGLEVLDPDTFTAFVEGASKMPLQFVCTRVGKPKGVAKGALKITTREKAGVA